MENKYLTAFTDGLRKFFGMPNASEAELDQKLQEAGTLEEARATAAVEMKETIDNGITEISTKVQNALTQFGDIDVKVTSLQTKVDQLETALGERDVKITALETANKDLAGEIATAKAGFSNTQNPADGGVQAPKVQATQTQFGTVVKTPELKERVFGKN